MSTITEKYINRGKSNTIWNGISAEKLLRRCLQAAPAEAEAMSHVASLMHAAEPIKEVEFYAARAALTAVEKRLIITYSGEINYNRHGQPVGGTHPALL